MATQVTDRRFFMQVRNWRVGTAAGAYSYVQTTSALGPLWWKPVDPIVTRIPLRGADFALKMYDIANYDLEGWIQVGDFEAVTQLLRTVDVVVGGGVETAVEWDSTPTRNRIAYFAFETYTLKIVNATDARTTPTTTYTFTGNVLIESIQPRLQDPSGPWIIHFYANYVTQTDG